MASPMIDLDIVNHAFTLRAEEPIHLPEYKGSAFHGGFAQALQAISPRWSDYFLKQRSEAGQVLPAPYVLLPPLDEHSVYAEGECFTLNLTLFGAANQHYAITQAAVEYLGRHMGLGYRQGKYSIQNIQISRPELQHSTRPQTQQRIQLQLTTRLRLKQDNRLQRQAPDFAQLMARLVGRIKTLEHAYAESADQASGVPDFHPDSLRGVSHQDHTEWHEWDRFSGRQKTWMKFGGLRGLISYNGELEEFMPWLRLGEWLHIGGKTSFGLGKYRLIEESTV